MAVVADRVIVELEAKLDRYTANVRAAEQRFNAATQNIQRNARQMETSIQRSSGSAGNAIRNLAGTFAAAFSARQVQQMADSYTRFINQLSVAGVEGTNLARVQGELFEIAQRNGVELEAVGTLYSRAAQNQRELGATTSDLIGLTAAVAASLKISGTSATQAGGALLQLGQALGSPRIQAEEFNSLLDTMQPLLREASTRIEGTGGTLSGLTRRIKDLNGPGVSNLELFRAIIASLGDLEDTASRATLTIGGAFTVLNNALGQYIGQTDDSLSATERISGAIITLSENLDTVSAALGLLGAVLLGRYVAGMVAASASTGLASTALFALQARAVGAATTMEALALTSATAGRALLAAFGGPVGIAVTALAIGVYYLTTRTGEAAQASAEYARQQEVLRDVQNRTTDAVERLATATGRARAEAIANAQALRQETVQYIANARAALLAAQAKAMQSRRDAQTERNAALRSSRGAGGGIDPAITAINRGDQRVAQADANWRAAIENVTDATTELNRLNRALEAPPAVRPVAPARTTGHGARGRQGPDPDDIARRFEDDLERYRLEFETAQADITGTLQARADLERRRIRAEQESNARSINSEENYSAAQRERLLLLNDQVAQARLAAIRAAEQEQERADELALALAGNENQRDLLERQSRLAETTAERRDAELRLLELQYEEERLRLEAIRDNTRLNETEREIARRRLAQLNAMHEAERVGVERQYEGAGQRYLRGLRAEDINEQLDEVRVRGLQRLEDQIVSTTAKIFKMGGVFGDVANQIIADLIRIAVQRALIEPLANLMFGSGGGKGGGGIFGTILSGVTAIFGGAGGGIGGGLPKKASGGHIMGGRLYQVNETGIEGFQAAGSGKIIPLGQMNAPGPRGAPGQPSALRIYVTPSEYFDVRVEQISGNVAVDTVRAAAPGLTDLAVAETFRRADRPEL